MSKRKKFVFGFLGVIIILVVIAVAQHGSSSDPTEDDSTEHFITANPLDLTQIQGFSRYRSCEGHDYRHPRIDGVVESSPRSMKHYVEVNEEFRGTIDKVDVFAPFDGKIASIEDEYELGKQVSLEPAIDSDIGWRFVFFHIVLDDGLVKGSAITAGQHIGYASLSRGEYGDTTNFDIAMKAISFLNKPAVDAVFTHATPEVLDEYAAYGVSEEDFEISEEERDENPCSLKDAPGNESDVFLESRIYENDFIWLTSK